MQSLHQIGRSISAAALLLAGLSTAAPLVYANQEVHQSVGPNGVYQSVQNGGQHVVQVVNSKGVHQDINNGDQHVSQNVYGRGRDNDRHEYPPVKLQPPIVSTSPPSATTPAPQPVISSAAPVSNGSSSVPQSVANETSSSDSPSGGSGGGSGRDFVCTVSQGEDGLGTFTQVLLKPVVDSGAWIAIHPNDFRLPKGGDCGPTLLYDAKPAPLQVVAPLPQAALVSTVVEPALEPIIGTPLAITAPEPELVTATVPDMVPSDEEATPEDEAPPAAPESHTPAALPPAGDGSTYGTPENPLVDQSTGP